jgi:elongation factor P--beta-lysine ligase
VALGIDRLCMLCQGSDSLAKVMAFANATTD